MLNRTCLPYVITPLICVVFGCGDGSTPPSLDAGKPKPEYEAAVKEASAVGVMVTCDNEGEVTFLDFHANPQISEAVAHVKSFPNLKMLNFSSSKLSDADMESIGSATKVEELGLHGTQISDEGLKHVSGLKNLRFLNLTDTTVGDAGLAHLTGLQSLARLNLQNTKVTDEGLKLLESFPQLAYVVLSNSNVTEEGVKRLREAFPDAEVEYEIIEDLSDEPMLTDDQLPD